MKDSEIERKGRYIVKRRSQPPTQKPQNGQTSTNSIAYSPQPQNNTETLHLPTAQEGKTVKRKIIKFRNNVKNNKRKTPLGNDKDNMKGTAQRTCNKNQEEIPQFLIADKKRGRSNKKWSEVGQSVEKIM